MTQLELFTKSECSFEVREGRVCSKCNELLPLSSFSPHSGSSVLLRSECKKCNKHLSQTREELRRKYGMPDQDYQCPICNGKEEDVAGKGGSHLPAWVIDHCHTTDKFRGWLCHPCNRALGGFKDNIKALQNAIHYLKNI